MVVPGALVNSAVTAFAAACYGFVGIRLVRRGHARATSLFMGLVALYLLLAALRQIAAAFENVEVDRTIFLLLLAPAAYAIAPLMVVAGRVASDNPNVNRTLMGASLLASSVGLGFAFAGGISGPTTSSWGTDWRLNSTVARALVLFAILLPGLIASVYLVRVGRRVTTAPGRRAVLLGWSCGVFFVVFTADAFGLSGLSLVLARLLTALAAMVAYVAYARRPNDEGPQETRGEKP